MVVRILTGSVLSHVVDFFRWVVCGAPWSVNVSLAVQIQVKRGSLLLRLLEVGRWSIKVRTDERIRLVHNRITQQ